MRKVYRKTITPLSLLLFVIAAFFLACSERAVPTPEIKVPEKPTADVSWQQQWENLLKTAQKEGRVSIYSGMERDTILALRKHFTEQYKIDLDIVSGGSSQINAKLFMERQNGLYIPDLYIEGPTSPITEYKPRGILQPLDKYVFRPDVLNEKDWWGGYGPYFDKNHFLAAGSRAVSPAIIINRKMVSPGELTSYNDLLDPRWKGKILLGDPTVSGGPQSAMIDTLIIMGEDYIRKLSEQIGAVTRDRRLITDWVIREKYPVGFGHGSSIPVQYINEGANIEMLSFKEGHGAGASGVIVLFDRPPNPNAAKLFINWFLTKDAQQIYAVASGKMSRRLDVSDQHLLPAQRMKEGVRYVISDEEYYLKKDQYVEIINKYYLNR